MHEPLADQIYFQSKFKPPQKTPNIVKNCKAIPRRESSVKCTLISFNQKIQIPTSFSIPPPFCFAKPPVHQVQFSYCFKKYSNFSSEIEPPTQLGAGVRRKKHVVNPIVNTDFFSTRWKSYKLTPHQLLLLKRRQHLTLILKILLSF